MNAHQSQYVARLLTPQGRGAVASIEVLGSTSDSDHPVDCWFTPAGSVEASRLPVNRIAFGQWEDEDVVVCRCADDVVEVHCHGGRLAVARILDNLRSSGCSVIDRAAEPLTTPRATGDFAATAVQELTDRLLNANTLKASNLLLRQLSGELATALDQLSGLKRHEERNELIVSLLGDLTDEATDRIVTGRNIALFGQPNAGKSSLMNALLGYERAIVFHQPGTTRDALVAETAFGGWPVRLIDTAGVRQDAQSELEASGIARAEQAVESSDVILLLYDVACGWTSADDALLARVPSGVPVIIAANKIDLSPDPAIRDRTEFDRAVVDVVPVSATEVIGIDRLVQSVSRQLETTAATSAIVGAPTLRAFLRDMQQTGNAGDEGLQKVVDCLRTNAEFTGK